MAVGGLGVVDEVVDEAVDAVDLVGHVPGERLLNLLAVALGANERGKGADGHEGISDFVSDTGGDARQRRGFLPLEFLLPLLLGLGYVDDRHQNAGDRFIANDLVGHVAVGAGVKRRVSETKNAAVDHRAACKKSLTLAL